ncbi:unnamed protein product [Durusdinium trenchii]|uniref:Uncharacterized protein n=1 Tax=Durusdinium trenchii TaxID=1381693 RepID=A0ABP0R722_9DINO
MVAVGVAPEIEIKVKKRQSRREHQEADEESKEPRRRGCVGIDPLLEQKANTKRIAWRSLDERYTHDEAECTQRDWGRIANSQHQICQFLLHRLQWLQRSNQSWKISNVRWE